MNQGKKKSSLEDFEIRTVERNTREVLQSFGAAALRMHGKHDSGEVVVRRPEGQIS